MKVSGKFQGGDPWLGSSNVPGEWALVESNDICTRLETTEVIDSTDNCAAVEVSEPVEDTSGLEGEERCVVIETSDAPTPTEVVESDDICTWVEVSESIEGVSGSVLVEVDLGADSLVE
jgi:hypothetical protein